MSPCLRCAASVETEATRSSSPPSIPGSKPNVGRAARGRRDERGMPRERFARPSIRQAAERERFYTGLEQRRTRIVLDRPDLTLMAVALKAVDTIEAGPLQVFIADPSGDADELSAPLLFSTKSTRTAGGFLIPTESRWPARRRENSGHRERLAAKVGKTVRTGILAGPWPRSRESRWLDLGPVGTAF